jgi:urease accessory protein
MESISVSHLARLRLMHLADSALPIGSAAHSFGIETLVEYGEVKVADLLNFFTVQLQETGLFEAACCRIAYALGKEHDIDILARSWISLNQRIAAMKTSRESRVASATLGRRFLQLAIDLEPDPLLMSIQDISQRANIDIFQCSVFGIVGYTMQIDADTTTITYLHQSLMTAVSACQRLLPLGQKKAHQLLWQLKPVILAIGEKSAVTSKDLDNISSFLPLIEQGSLMHPTLRTRLFIS